MQKANINNAESEYKQCGNNYKLNMNVYHR